MAKAHRLIGVCLAQAHTFLKTDFLVELEKDAMYPDSAALGADVKRG